MAECDTKKIAIFGQSQPLEFKDSKAKPHQISAMNRTTLPSTKRKAPVLSGSFGSNPIITEEVGPLIGVASEKKRGRGRPKKIKKVWPFKKKRDHGKLVSSNHHGSPPSLSEPTEDEGNQRRSSRQRSKPKKLVLDGTNAGYELNLTEEYYKNARMDEYEDMGRELWMHNKAARIKFLQKCPGNKNENWSFYPSKHGTKNEVSSLGTKCVHYASGYRELGIMVKKYGKDVARDWPNLPSIAERDRTPAVTAITGSEANQITLPDDPTTSAPIITRTMAAPTTSNTSSSWRKNLASMASSISTGISRRKNRASMASFTSTGISRQNGRASMNSVAVTPERHASNDIIPESTAREESSIPASSDTYPESTAREENIFPPKISTRLQRLEDFLIGSQKERGCVLKRLKTLEQEVFGNQYDKELKGIVPRLERLEKM